MIQKNLSWVRQSINIKIIKVIKNKASIYGAFLILYRIKHIFMV